MRPISSCSTSGLPDVDGLDLVSEAPASVPPVIAVCTGDPGGRATPMPSAIAAELFKPFDTADLVASVGKVFAPI